MLGGARKRMRPGYKISTPEKLTPDIEMKEILSPQILKHLNNFI